MIVDIISDLNYEGNKIKKLLCILMLMTCCLTAIEPTQSNKNLEFGDVIIAARLIQISALYAQDAALIYEY